VQRRVHWAALVKKAQLGGHLQLSLPISLSLSVRPTAEQPQARELSSHLRQGHLSPLPVLIGSQPIAGVEEVEGCWQLA